MHFAFVNNESIYNAQIKVFKLNFIRLFFFFLVLNFTSTKICWYHRSSISRIFYYIGASPLLRIFPYTCLGVFHVLHGSLILQILGLTGLSRISKIASTTNLGILKATNCVEGPPLYPRFFKLPDSRYARRRGYTRRLLVL